MERFTTSDGKDVGFKGDMDMLAEALLRLSKYEDTGLLPEEVAELQKKVERQDADIDFLLKCITDRLGKRYSVEMISLRGENVLLRAEIGKAEKEILYLKKQIEDLLARKQEDSNMDRFLEDLNGTINCSEARFTVHPVNMPDSDTKLTPKKKQKIAWEAD